MITPYHKEASITCRGALITLNIPLPSLPPPSFRPHIPMYTIGQFRVEIVTRNMKHAEQNIRQSKDALCHIGPFVTTAPQDLRKHQ